MTSLNIEMPQILNHTEKSINYSLFDVKWVPNSARIVALGSYPRGSGALNVYTLSGQNLELLSSAEKTSAFKCGTFEASSLEDRKLATGAFDGVMQLWDLEDISQPVFSVKAHSEIINCIDGFGGSTKGKGAPEIVTGSRDGSVKVWDVRQPTPVAVIEPNPDENKRDCWAVSFGNSYNQEERSVAAGYDNGDLKIFDLRTMSILFETNLKNGICSIEFDRKDIKKNKLVATTLGSQFHLFNLRNTNLKNSFPSLVMKAHNSTVWCVRFLPQNREIFMTCGGNGGSVILWKYSYSEEKNSTSAGNIEKLQSCTFSSQPVTSMDWNKDKTGLFVCGAFDQTLRTAFVTKLNKI